MASKRKKLSENKIPKGKSLSSPYSTGGIGYNFEAHIQSLFVSLLLTRGHSPCLPTWPIIKIKLQARIDGFHTDDLVVFVKNPENEESRKLLVQVKRSISVLASNKELKDSLHAAWLDFINPENFTKNKDQIAIITGPINSLDYRVLTWIINQAKHTKDTEEFFHQVDFANFSPRKTKEKLKIIAGLLKSANGNTELTREELFQFLRHLHYLGSDLDNEEGITRSILTSYFSQFQAKDTHLIWSRITDYVRTVNQNAGSITTENLPEELKEVFKEREVFTIPEEFKPTPPANEVDWINHPKASEFFKLTLVGSWVDQNPYDQKNLSSILDFDYNECIRIANEFLHFDGAPITLNNGVWKISERQKIFEELGTRLLVQHLELFESLVLEVLGENDPALELNPEERYTSNIRGKILKHSPALRSGLVEGLAILSNNKDFFSNISPRQIESISRSTTIKLLHQKNWEIWASLESVLPSLSEVSPETFLSVLDKETNQKNNQFLELFAQETSGITGRTYMSGLLWALETLAWREDLLVRVCLLLAKLSDQDPGGKWANRPSSSLRNILLPWSPQTLADNEKCLAAVKTILNENPETGWTLLLQLLPGQYQSSSGTHKPKWIVPKVIKREVTKDEYWKMSLEYASLAVEFSGKDVKKIADLLQKSDTIPYPAFEQLLQKLQSEEICGLPENELLLIWNELNKFLNKQRRFSDTSWSLTEQNLKKLDEIASKLSPQNPIYKFQHLFTNRAYELFDGKGSFSELEKKVEDQRDKAISKIFTSRGMEGVMDLLSLVESGFQVGYSLGSMSKSVILSKILPDFLGSNDPKNNDLAKGFVRRRFLKLGWNWVDKQLIKKWTSEQIGELLSILPFEKETWRRAEKWLKANENQFWQKTPVHFGRLNNDFEYAVSKLIEYGRPFRAIECLSRLSEEQKQLLDSHLCVKALQKAISSTEPSYSFDQHLASDLIKRLQNDAEVDKETMANIEWSYLPILDNRGNASPITLESKLVNNPDFFCHIIQLIYKSENEEESSKEPNQQTKDMALNAYRLLQVWEKVPGTDYEGNFNPSKFEEWVNGVKERCNESGHLKAALNELGKVLIHSKPDPGGLWVNKTIAKELNKNDSEDLRLGFRIGLVNSRGAHWVDPTGQPEFDLANEYFQKANDSENAGYHRLAVTLREIAKNYESEANDIKYGRL